MKFVGIDIGDGETTASCIDTDNVDGRPLPLRILNGNGGDECKVESIMCKDAQGNWKFATDEDYNKSNYSCYFKAKVNENMQEDQKEAFGAFVKLVYNHILANNNFSNEDKRNLCIYAACPSKWAENDEQVMAYKKFLNDNGVPVKWIMKESDAACFKFMKTNRIAQNNSILVIDIGSSTIDFSFYDAQTQQGFSEGRTLGARRVENAILGYLQNNSERFNAAEEEARDICNANNLKWRNAVLHEIRKEKEYFYTHSKAKLRAKFDNYNIYDELKVSFDEGIDRNTLENVILKDYKERLVGAFKNIKDERQINPSTIILTGGASRMTWLRPLVEDVFVRAKVMMDPDNPSYIVSDGLAYYAKAVHDLEKMAEGAIDCFKENYKEEELKKLVHDSLNESWKEVFMKYNTDICKKFNGGKLPFMGITFAQCRPDDSNCYIDCRSGGFCTAEFITQMYNHKEYIKNNQESAWCINRDKNERIKEKINKELGTIFKKKLNDKTILKNPSPEIDVGKINIGNISFESYDVEWEKLRVWIQICTNKVYSDWPWPFDNGNIFKERNSNHERQQFSNAFLDYMKTATIDIFYRLSGNLDELVKQATLPLIESLNSAFTVDRMFSKRKDLIFELY